MINIGKLLDACGIPYTDKQLSKLDKLLNKLLKKLSLQQLDSNETTPYDSTSDCIPDSEDKYRNEEFASETKLKSMEEFNFKHEPYYNNTIKEEILEDIAIEIKEECPKDPFASLETFDDSESGESIKSSIFDTRDKLKSNCMNHIATVSSPNMIIDQHSASTSNTFCLKRGKTSHTEEGKKPRLYKCSVPQCKLKVEKYFSYPSNEKQRALWLEAFGLTECKSRAIICKSHFLESDIVTRNLKYGAVPTLNLPER